MWFGTKNGVSRFDGTTWTKFYKRTDGLANNTVNSIALDTHGTLWFGTFGGGVSSFDGVTWKTYTTADGLVNNYVFSIAEDKKGDLWFGTMHGVSQFDGATWTNYTTVNGLTDDLVLSVVVDADDVKWFGTSAGASSFDDRTKTSVEEQVYVHHRGMNIQGNFPNPFNPTTTIEFSLPEAGFAELVIYNVMGQKVRELVTGTMTPGVHSVVWDSRDDHGQEVSAGVYVSRLNMSGAVTTGKMTLVK